MKRLNTLDRINKLNRYYNLDEITSDNLNLQTRRTCDDRVMYVSHSPVHDVIAWIDAAAGIDTKYRDSHQCECTKDKWTCAGDHRELNYVGARLARHESHIFVTSGAMYHWLGRDAEKQAA